MSAGRCRRRSRSTPACAGSASLLPRSSGSRRARWPGLELTLVMSHLACAEEPDHPLNERQRQALRALRGRLPAARASLANSSGIFLGARLPLRPPAGRASRSTASIPTPGRPIRCARWSLSRRPLLQVHDVDASGTVGYGATYATRRRDADRDRPARLCGRLAARRGPGGRGPDRGPRRAARGPGLDGPDHPRRLGASRPRCPPRPMVALIEGPDAVDELARAAGTIGYEVLTRLGSRFARRYIPARTSKDLLHEPGRRHRPRLPELPRQPSAIWPLFAGRAIAPGADRAVLPAHDPASDGRHRLLFAAGGRADRDLHRHGPGASEPYGLRPLRGARARSRPSSFCR